ncbi:hypothetical protein DYB25_013215 [Aphanomyces astaci]|uniref:Uncharacterized protein n=1 Tax=Aphanomyces astaci TaxID=112090 RepID=A0A397EF38_APHAT|nr:hypothetical protein DYB25_013215 [Aphanomyces astaci]RHY43943.1 hypothetical protein DYB34_003909 [Aphanomyces astaci]RHY78948.1 hypothetical protein DYB38_001328 [Aphanomyces astaci]
MVTLAQPRDTVLQLQGRHDGQEVAIDICIESTNDWAFVHAILLRLGAISCATYPGDKLQLRSFQLQDLDNAYTLFPPASRSAPYSCSAFRAFNPYRSHVVPSATSSVYPHITLHSMENAAILRASKMLVCMQSLEWERIDVLFESALAHEQIIAKRSHEVPAHESGLDIVHHIADTFVVD